MCEISDVQNFHLSFRNLRVHRVKQTAGCTFKSRAVTSRSNRLWRVAALWLDLDGAACPVQAVSIRWHLQQTLIDLPAPGFVWLRLSQSGFAARGGSEVELTPVSRLRVRGSNVWGQRSRARLCEVASLRCGDSDQQVRQVRSGDQSSRGNRSLAQFSPTVSNYRWGGPIHQAWHLLDSIIPTLPVWLQAPHVRLRHKLREKKLKNYNKNRSDCLL